MDIAKNNGSWYLIGLGAFFLLLTATLLWVIPAGAAPAGAVAGVVTTSPGEVSSNDAVSTADRGVTITVTDADLNRSQFVGNGPNLETPDFGTSTGGETIAFGTTGAIGTRIFSVTLNGVNVDGTTPLADRDGDGDIDVNDIVIVDADIVGNDGLDDIEIASIFNASRGQIIFNIFAAIPQGTTFNLFYATSSRELTRGSTTITETLDAPPTGLIVDETFSRELALTLRDSNGDSSTNTGDVTVAGAAGLLISPGSTSADNKIVLYSPAAIGTGGAYTLTYTGDLVITLSTGLLRSTAATGDDVTTGALPTGVTLQPAVATSGDIQVVAVSASGRVTGDIEVGPVGTGLAIIARTSDFPANSTVTVRLGVVEAKTVPNTAIVQGEAFTLNLESTNLPLQDTNGDGLTSSGDITIKVGTRSLVPAITGIGLINSSDRATGIVNGVALTLRHSGDDIAIGDDIGVTYLGLRDLVTVKGARADSLAIRLRETGVDTGVYSGSFVVINGSNDEANQSRSNLNPNLSIVNVATADFPRISVINGGSVTVSYIDGSPVGTRTFRIRVEADGPTFSNVAPADNSATNNTSDLLTAEASDSIAGVDPATGSSINVVFGTSGASISGDAIVGTSTTTGGNAISIAETFAGSGVYKISYSIANIPDVASAIASATEITNLRIVWQIRVRDKAGNEGFTTPRILTVDNTKPVLVDAFTGDNWDPEDARMESARPGLPGSDVRTSIRVEFDGTMDGTTFQTSDFLVGGVAPLDVDHFAGSADSVFLTVPLMAPDATPVVQIMGSVSDDGGNALTTGSVTAKDGIAPALTVTFINDINYSTGTISLSVVSDEKIAGSLARRTIRQCLANNACTTTANFSTVTRIVTEQLEWTFDLTVASTGQHNVLVEAEDTAGNQASAGSTSDPRTTGALTFEIDTGIPAPISTTPAADATASEAEPFVFEINWRSEGDGTEWTGDAHAAVTLTSAVLDQGTTTERNVLPLHSSRDNRSFSIAISAIGLGEHTLTYNGQDELGNSLTTARRVKFTVVAPPKFTVTLLPGLNLVSIPRDPLDGDINSVFSGLTQVKLIFTRPRVSEGEPDVQWLQAERDPSTGLFEATGTSIDLTTIDSRHAYWVEASATVAVEIVLPPLAATNAPPILPVSGGAFNLVPIMSLAPLEPATATASTADIKEGTEFDADVYFGTNWTSAFTFDQGQWIGITPGRTPDGVVTTVNDGVQVGRGYWVLFTVNEILSPGIP